MAHINSDPEYYLARCTGDDYEKTEAAEFHRQNRPSDRDIVLKGLLAADAPAELIELAESGADMSWGDAHWVIIEVLNEGGLRRPSNRMSEDEQDRHAAASERLELPPQ